MSSSNGEASKKRKLAPSPSSTNVDAAQHEAIQAAIEAGLAARLAAELPALRQACVEAALHAVSARLSTQDATLARLGATTPFVDVDEGAVDEDDEALPVNPADGRIHVSMTRAQLRTIRLRNASVQQLHARISHLEAAVLAMQANVQSGATTAAAQYLANGQPQQQTQQQQQQQQAFLPHPPPTPAFALAWPLAPQSQASSSQAGPSTLPSAAPALASPTAAEAAAEALRKRHKKGKAKSATPLEGEDGNGSPSGARKKGGGGLKPNIHLQEAFRLQVRLEAGVPSGPIPGALAPGAPIPRHAVSEAEQAAWDALPASQKEGRTLQGKPMLRFDWSLHRDDPRAVEFVRSRVEQIYRETQKHGLTAEHLPPLEEGVEACFVTFKRIGRTARLAKQTNGNVGANAQEGQLEQAGQQGEQQQQQQQTEQQQQQQGQPLAEQLLQQQVEAAL